MYTGFYTPTPPPKKNKFIAFFICSICVVFVLCGVLVYLIADYDVYDEQPPEDEEEIWPTQSLEPVVTPKTTLPPGEKPNLVIADIPSPNPQTEVLTASQVYTKVAPCVVAVVALDNDREEIGTGTGAIVSSDGYIFTNHHVVDNASYATVIFSDGTEYEAVIVGMDYLTDLAIIKIEEKNLPTIELGNSDQLKPGDKAYAIGNPLGLELQNTITDGIISAINRDIQLDGDIDMTVLQTNCAVNPGNSGGPLCNEYGQVVGIISSKIMGDYSATMEGLGFAIPISSATPILQTLMTKGYVTGRPAIGIIANIEIEINKDNKDEYGVSYGVLIESVNKQSDAYAQGVKKGDIITKVNGQDVYSVYEINEIKKEFLVGDKLTMTIYRDGKTLEIDVELVEQGILE